MVLFEMRYEVTFLLFSGSDLLSRVYLSQAEEGSGGISIGDAGRRINK